MTRPTQTKNPAKRGNADGANKGKLSKREHTAPGPVVQSADTFTRDRLAWLEAVTDAPALPKAAHRVAAKLALRFLSRERGIAWPSVATLAKSLGVDRKAILAATAALEGAGFLAVSRSKGRGHANEYTLTIGHEKGGENATFSNDEKGGENATFSEPLKGGVSAPEKVVKSGPHPLEGNPLKGAGAHSARPAPVSNSDVVLLTSDHNDAAVINGGRAPDGAPALTEADLSELLNAAPDHLDNAAALEIEDGRAPVTLADLDRLAAEEQAAAQAEAEAETLPPEWIDPARAVMMLERLWGTRLPISAQDHADDLLDGFILGDPQAQAFAVQDTVAALDTVTAERRAAYLATHAERVFTLFASAGRCPMAAELAAAAFAAAVRDAREERQAPAETPAAEMETAHHG